VAGHDRDCRDGHAVFDVFTGAKLALDKDGIGFLEAAGGLSQLVPAFYAEPVGRLLLLFALRPGLVDRDAEARDNVYRWRAECGRDLVLEATDR
jgi:hypothetical protein